MKIAIPRCVLAALVALAMLLSACGGATNDDVATTGSTTDESAAPSDQSATSDGDGAQDDAGGADDSNDSVAEDEPETIADLLGFGPNGPSQAEQEELQRQVEEKIAACMIEQGFEYTPFNPGQIPTFDNEVDRETREYAEENGFGIATGMGEMREMSDPTNQPPDPNREYVDSLSEGERDAYFAALFGPEFDREPELDENGEPDFEAMVMREPAGCQGEGNEARASQGQMMMTLMPSLMELESNFNADTRIVALNKDWSACMAEAGFDYAEPSDIFEDVFNRMFATTAVSGSAEGSSATFGPADGPLDAEGQAELDAVADYERSVAVANFDCSEDNKTEYGDIRAEYERRFIDENRDLIAEARGN